METNNQTEQTIWPGVYKAEDYAYEVQADWQTGIEPGKSTGWRSLDHLYRVQKKYWTVVTGIPSSGKSTVLDNMAVNLAEQWGWKFLICSPENQPVNRHIESLVEIHAGKKFVHPDRLDPRHISHAITGDEVVASMDFVNRHFLFINPEETDFHIDYLLELAYAIKNDADGFSFDGFILDPFNELDSKRPNAMSETEYISQLLSKWRRFCRGNDCHGWLVAHPAKLREMANTTGDAKARKIYAMPSLYDISGSAHWKNKADMGLVVYRNVNQKPETTTISVQKVRFREQGSHGEAELRYDTLCNRFVEHENELLYNRTR